MMIRVQPATMTLDDGRTFFLFPARIDSLVGIVYGCALVRCGYDGSYHPLADMEAWGDGWISKQGKEKRDEANPPASAGRGA
mgnify:CR=1 FL=1